jgi:hypothetical protein
MCVGVLDVLWCVGVSMCCAVLCGAKVRAKMKKATTIATVTFSVAPMSYHGLSFDSRNIPRDEPPGSRQLNVERSENTSQFQGITSHCIIEETRRYGGMVFLHGLLHPNNYDCVEVWMYCVDMFVDVLRQC